MKPIQFVCRICLSSSCKTQPCLSQCWINRSNHTCSMVLLKEYPHSLQQHLPAKQRSMITDPQKVLRGSRFCHWKCCIKALTHSIFTMFCFWFKLMTPLTADLFSACKCMYMQMQLQRETLWRLALDHLHAAGRRLYARSEMSPLPKG